MNSHPNMSVTTLTKVKPGELLLVDYRTPVLAIAAKSGEKRILVFLNPIDEGADVPSFADIDDDSAVISYGSDFDIEISQEREFIDLNNSKFYKLPGTLHVARTGEILLAARPCKGVSVYGSLFFNLKTGTHAVNGAAALGATLGASFGKWSLTLPIIKDESISRLRMFSFEISKK